MLKWQCVGICMLDYFHSCNLGTIKSTASLFQCKRLASSCNARLRCSCFCILLMCHSFCNMRTLVAKLRKKRSSGKWTELWEEMTGGLVAARPRREAAHRQVEQSTSKGSTQLRTTLSRRGEMTNPWEAFQGTVVLYAVWLYPII